MQNYHIIPAMQVIVAHRAGHAEDCSGDLFMYTQGRDHVAHGARIEDEA
jgi:hypothetical protein